VNIIAPRAQPNLPAEDRKRIAFLVTHSAAGGAQELWGNLAESFAEQGHEVVLAALYPHAESRRETSALTPWLHIIEHRPTLPHRQAALLWNLVGFFRRFRPHIVFTALPAANVLAPVAARLAGGDIRVVTSHHSPSNTYHPVLDRIDGLTGGLREVAATISVSDTVSRTHDGKSATYRAKRRTIKNALPRAVEAHIAALAAMRERSRARGRVVVATGRLAHQKNYPVLIRAAALAKDVEFRIIGAGPDEAPLKALAESLGVTDRVRFLGLHPRLQALSLLSEGDVFVQPSLFEGHSLALVEAAKLGLPIVVSDAPVQIEGVSLPDGTACGTIVGTHDHEALAREILRLLDNPEHYAEQAGLSSRLAAGATYDAMVSAYRNLVDQA
jgi:glycosyltransferase involved in cell wall biosynthesis